nr:malate synthase G [Endozoicomonas sp.]
MTERIQKGGLQIATVLYDLLVNEIVPGTGVDADQFWQSLEDLVQDLAPENKVLLAHRDEFQQKIDNWHRQNVYTPDTRPAYKSFLENIGYLLPEGDDFAITTENVDSEIAIQAGPQLVVPVMNARFALNAANARWGSLYDALYGTDVISESDGADKGKGYNPVRGRKVIEFGRELLDTAAPLTAGSHKDVIQYQVVENNLTVALKDGSATSLKDTGKFVGYTGSKHKPESILLKNNE